MRLRALAVGVVPVVLAGGVAAAAPATATTAQTQPPTAVSANPGNGYGLTVSDIGERPAVFKIAKETLKNRNFRTAAWTADDLQLTLMNIPVGGDVGLEMHSDVDQFLRVESGKAKVYFGDSPGTLRFAGVAQADSAVLVPSGTWHNIVNDSPKQPLKLYSLYGPAQHPQGTIHPTQADDQH